MRNLLLVVACLYCSSVSAQTFPTAFQKISALRGGMTVRPNPGARFGIEAAAIGDLDDDGVIDLGVGATNDGGFAIGSVYILFMKSDGTVKSSTVIYSSEPAGEADSFGSSVSALGDLNDDGIEDIGVGTQYDDDGGQDNGAFWVLFMNKNGTVKARQKISAVSGNLGVGIGSGAGFGSGSAAIGDLDGDGNIEVAVGARFTSTTYILFLNNNGTVKKAKTISSAQGLPIDSNGLVSYGLAGLGDVDKDGVPDLAIGGHRSDIGFTDSGVVYVVMLNSSGDLKSFKTISTGRGNFTDNASLLGISIAGIGDWDGDGIRDMAVGGDDSNQNTGAIWFMMLNADGTIKSSHKISSNTVGVELDVKTGDFFGSSICFLGDIDNNGTPDLAVGAFQDGDGGANTGAVWVSVPSACNFTSMAGDDITLCINQPVQMNANAAPAGTAGKWSVISGSATFSSLTNPLATVTGLTAGVNEFAWTISKPGCTDSKDIVKVSISGGDPANAGDDLRVCSIQTVQLDAKLTQGSSGKWSVVSGTGTFLSINEPNTIVTGLTIGSNEFKWTVSNPNCGVSSDNVKVIVDKTVFPDAGKDLLACEGTLAIALTGNQPVNMTAEWSRVIGGGTFTNNSSPSTIVTNPGVGINAYVLSFLASNYCPLIRDTVFVTLLPKPRAKISMPDTSYTCARDLFLNADTPNGLGKWTVTKGSATLEDPGNNKTTVSFDERNNPITVTWTVSSEVCPSAEESVTIVPLDFSIDKIPNVITPNNDRYNDKWEIPNISRVPNQVRLYNRWGKEVFSTLNYKNDWSGGDLSAGVYFFFINIAECKTELKGWLTIIN